MNSWRKLAAPLLLSIAFALAGLPAAGQQVQSHSSGVGGVSAEDLLAVPVGANWTSYNGDYSGRRYSSLHEITAANVAHLRASW